MTDTPLTPQQEDDALAAEYVLGLLTQPERLAVETRLKRDPTLSRRIIDWENRLAGLNEDFAPAPPPDLIDRIEARLFPRAAAPTRRYWLSGLAGAAAITLAVLVMLPPGPPPLHATLTSEDASLHYEARFSDGSLTVAFVEGRTVPTGKSLELWLIPPAQPAIALGLLTRADFVITHEPPPPGSVLAISLEPQGGSPTGAPTGPVLAATAITLP